MVQMTQNAAEELKKDSPQTNSAQTSGARAERTFDGRGDHSSGAQNLPPQPKTEIQAGPSIYDRILGVKEDFTTLYRQEIALAKAEVREGAEKVKASTGAMAAGAVLLASSVTMLLASVAALISWLVLALGGSLISALGVGFAGAALIGALTGAAFLKAGQKKLQNSKLSVPRTKETLQRSKDLIEDQTPNS